jgi:hypothetical protein
MIFSASLFGLTDSRNVLVSLRDQSVSTFGQVLRCGKPYRCRVVPGVSNEPFRRGNLTDWSHPAECAFTSTKPAGAAYMLCALTSSAYKRRSVSGINNRGAVCIGSSIGGGRIVGRLQAKSVGGLMASLCQSAVISATIKSTSPNRRMTNNSVEARYPDGGTCPGYGSKSLQGVANRLTAHCACTTLLQEAITLSTAGRGSR